jgi:serine/threonine protein kinase
VDLIGKYEIQDKLGSGGFGTVYRAVDRTMPVYILRAIEIAGLTTVGERKFLGHRLLLNGKLRPLRLLTSYTS